MCSFWFLTLDKSIVKHMSYELDSLMTLFVLKPTLGLESALVLWQIPILND